MKKRVYRMMERGKSRKEGERKTCYANMLGQMGLYLQANGLKSSSVY